MDENFSESQKHDLKALKVEANFIARTSQQHIENLRRLIYMLTTRKSAAISEAKASIPKILGHLRSATDSLQVMATAVEHFQNIVILPNFTQLTPFQLEQMWEITMNFKSQSVNEHESMIVEQVQQQEKDIEDSYQDTNMTWHDKIRSLNSSLNKCAQYVQKYSL